MCSRRSDALREFSPRRQAWYRGETRVGWLRGPGRSASLADYRLTHQIELQVRAAEYRAQNSGANLDPSWRAEREAAAKARSQATLEARRIAIADRYEAEKAARRAKRRTPPRSVFVGSERLFEFTSAISRWQAA
jgi:hypothetical protein